MIQMPSSGDCERPDLLFLPSEENEPQMAAPRLTNPYMHPVRIKG
jgi:hypothetical protein